MPRPSRLSLELLETFVAIVAHEGDATLAAQELGVNQPSLSKRLAALRAATGARSEQAWLVRKGRRWRLTGEGQRVLGAVSDTVSRYRQLEAFLASGRAGMPMISIACGQQAAIGFVGAAIERFLRRRPDAHVRLATPRGRVRIEGVAAGQFDLAVVTDSPSTVRQIARREMYIERLFDDHFVLAANPPPKSAWGRHWHQIPANKPAHADLLHEFPFILPEPDAARRRQFDDWCYQATGKTLNVHLETGGWQTILAFVEAGLGVGLVPHSAIDIFRVRNRAKLTTRTVDPAAFPADAVQLIARKAHGKEEPDVTPIGESMAGLLREEARRVKAS